MARSVWENYAIIFFFSVLITSNKSFDQINESGFTITISPGTVDCFYQTVKIGEVLEIEYQVIDSSYGNGNIGQGDLQVNFQLFSPTGSVLISETQKGEGTHRVDVKEAGDFQICIDNKNSRFAHKTVYLEVYVDTGEESDDNNNNWEDLDFAPELMYNDSIEVIKTRVSKIRDHLSKVEHFQSLKRANEARDRNLQEHNFIMVNAFSFLSIVVLMTVGSIQVYMLRSLFEDRSKLHKIFKVFS